MSVNRFEYPNRDAWLNARKAIGGSDAACILGMNPWKTNVELYLEKTGQREPEDISDKELVKYGTDAEAPLRRLFALDHPDLKVHYRRFNMWTNDRYPWAHASLDGWLTDKDGRLGVLEIKTTNIMNSRQKEQWHNKIPDNYYIQVLHCMAITEADFAVVKAQLKWEIPLCDGRVEVYCQTRHYRIERTDVEADIDYLMSAEDRFAKNIQYGVKPDQILPEI